MFDFRYHVASLVALFLALIVGILLGIGLSGQGFIEESERDLLKDAIAERDRQLDRERRRSTELDAAAAFVESAYDTVIADRLSGKRIAIVVVGSVDSRVQPVEDAITDAGGERLRLRAIDVPIDPEALAEALAERPAVAGFGGGDRLENLGEALGREFVNGGETRVWDAVEQELVVERSGTGEPAADGVVLIRSSAPQAGPTAHFLRGFYAGLQSSVPVVGVESSTADPSAIPAFRRARLSTVDNVDSPIGRVSLAVLLAGGARGNFGFGEDTLVPPIEPVPPETGG